jgi:hypothetical protein
MTWVLFPTYDVPSMHAALTSVLSPGQGVQQKYFFRVTDEGFELSGTKPTAAEVREGCTGR